MVIVELNKLPRKIAGIPVQDKEPVFTNLTLR